MALTMPTAGVRDSIDRARRLERTSACPSEARDGPAGDGALALVGRDLPSRYLAAARENQSAGQRGG